MVGCEFVAGVFGFAGAGGAFAVAKSVAVAAGGTREQEEHLKEIAGEGENFEAAGLQSGGAGGSGFDGAAEFGKDGAVCSQEAKTSELRVAPAKTSEVCVAPTACSSRRSFTQLPTCSSPQPAMMCSPFSSVVQITGGSDVDSFFKPSTSVGNPLPSLTLTATSPTGDTLYFMTAML